MQLAFACVFRGQSWRGTTLCEPFSRLGGKIKRAWNLPCQKGEIPLWQDRISYFPGQQKNRMVKLKLPQLKAAVGVVSISNYSQSARPGNFLNIFGSALRPRQAGLVSFCPRRLKWRSSAMLDQRREMNPFHRKQRRTSILVPRCFQWNGRLARNHAVRTVLPAWRENGARMEPSLSKRGHTFD